MNHSIEAVFARSLGNAHRTRLWGGTDEPWYAPAADGETMHTIWYRADYAASALHEVAHWCIASAARRRLPDYGYWYQGERDQAAQRVFEAVEVRPQALEWIFNEACGLAFRESVDNLAYPEADTARFREQIRCAAQRLLQNGLPTRAAAFVAALEAEFGGSVDAASVYR